MTIKVKTLVPAHATHPGEILKDVLESRQISQTDFAKDYGIALPQLNELIKGKRNISADFALILEKLLDIPAADWMKFQSAYELDVSRIKDKVKDKIALIERWNTIKGYIPVTFFKKQKVLTDNLEENEKIIKEIYNVKDIDGIINATTKPCYAHYKKSTAVSENAINVAGWFNYVVYQSKSKSVSKFSSQQKDEIINELKKISLHKNVISKTEKLLNEHGIKFIQQSKPDKAPIDGVSFWVDSNPTIGVTVRHKRLDNFIFTVMHELGHIFLHLQKNRKQEFLDDMDDITYMSGNTFEKEANDFASNNLINQKSWDSFMQEHFTIDDEAITELADELKIHPAIVKGRLCFEQPVYYRKRFSIANQIS